jgi:hypothetical protein
MCKGVLVIFVLLFLMREGMVGTVPDILQRIVIGIVVFDVSFGNFQQHVVRMDTQNDIDVGFST